MRILLAANIAPFLAGGADYHISGLTEALRDSGHDVVCLRFPFQFSPPAAIESLMDFCEDYDINAPNGVSIDCLLSLQFPAYGLRHDNHRVWIMHQHRAAYELYDDVTASESERRLMQRVRAFDARVLARIPRRFANSERVAARLRQYNGLDSVPLYHPPHQPTRFRCAAAERYIFFPSRLETLKRQDVLIEAARLVKAPIGFLLAGTGGQQARYQRLIDQHGLAHKVRLLGHVTEAEKRTYYAHALAVFYGPFDEDYGYVTLEAMLAAKPVITCSDSGGPLELVEHEHTGLVVEPRPDAVADAIERLYQRPAETARMGRAGRERYHRLGISWEQVVERLLAS